MLIVVSVFACFVNVNLCLKLLVACFAVAVCLCLFANWMFEVCGLLVVIFGLYVFLYDLILELNVGSYCFCLDWFSLGCY